MHRFLVAAAAAFLAGCAGSGGSSSSDGGETGGPLNQFGSIETRGQVKGVPIVRDLNRISTTALAGVLTEATYRPQGRPDNETAIVTGTYNGLEFYMPDGEYLGKVRPTNAPADDPFLLPVFSPDGTKLYYFGLTGIYSINPASPGTATAVIPISGIIRFALSPDGLRIAYVRRPSGEDDYEVYVRDVAGGPTRRLTNNGDNDDTALWLDNDRVVCRRNGLGSLIIDVATLATENYTPLDPTVFPIGSARDGRLLLNSATSDSSPGLSITDFDGENFNLARFKNYPVSGLVLTPFSASASPDQSKWIVNTIDSTFITEIAPQTVTQVTPSLPNNDRGVAWQPALGVTKFVGSSARLGSTSAGIIATNRSGNGRRGLASFVSWDCQTRSTSTISDDATDPGVGSKTYTIEADRLTALRYANRPFFEAVNTVSAAGTANGAIVTVDSEDGLVSSIAVFQETRGVRPTIRREGQNRAIEGRLLGVWDAKGKNLAPQGAAKVILDPKGAPTLG